jgi:uncharacterized coiled-coil DUF342 family protein
MDLVHDRDRDRVEKIAGLLAEVKTLREELEYTQNRRNWLNDQMKMHKEIADNQTFHVTELRAELARERELREDDKKQWGKLYNALLEPKAKPVATTEKEKN